MIRSAAKNFQDVAVVTSPADYDAIAEEMARSGITLSQRNKVAAGAESICDDCGLRFRDRFHAGTGGRQSLVGLSEPAEGFPQTLRLIVSQSHGPAIRRESAPEGRDVCGRFGVQASPCTAGAGQRAFLQQHCRSASGVGLAQEFDEPVCAIIKHTNPCGTATGKTLAEAYVRALECDPVSAFGGVIGVNRIGGRRRRRAKWPSFFSR
jgi:phosphoribosylaminoimidazolecarboxamide formyltransferase / IMP cyclohydrolase